MVSNVCSIDGAQRTEGTEPRVIDRNHGLTTGARPVWVRLDAIYVRDPGRPRHINGSGVLMEGEVQGRLTHWVPTVDGGWLGRVSYPVQYADGRKPLWMHDQLVPEYALRPRPEGD